MLLTRAGMMAIIWNPGWYNGDWTTIQAQERYPTVGNALFVSLMREFHQRSSLDRIV